MSGLSERNGLAKIPRESPWKTPVARTDWDWDFQVCSKGVQGQPYGAPGNVSATMLHLGVWTHPIQESET